MELVTVASEVKKLEVPELSNAFFSICKYVK